MSLSEDVTKSLLCIRCAAYPQAARRLRHVLSAFLDAIQTKQDVCENILIATGEALANAVEHAYEGTTPGFVTLAATYHEPHKIHIEVADTGSFIERDERPGRGFGMRIMHSVAQTVEVAKGDGTCVTMSFAL
jgi:serine/threonine-protein kinase RsbW